MRGRSARRARVPARSPGLLLLIGALVLPTVVLTFILQDNVSTGGRAWELAVTAVHLPLEFAWALLGWAVWGGAGRPAGAH